MNRWKKSVNDYTYGTAMPPRNPVEPIEARANRTVPLRVSGSLGFCFDSLLKTLNNGSWCGGCCVYNSCPYYVKALSSFFHLLLSLFSSLPILSLFLSLLFFFWSLWPNCLSSIFSSNISTTHNLEKKIPLNLVGLSPLLHPPLRSVYSTHCLTQKQINTGKFCHS